MSDATRLEAAGFSPAAAEAKAQLLQRAEAALQEPGVARDEVQRYVVPGRIEVLGKHTDYAGGRSLLCAAERAIALVAAPRGDNLVRVARVETKETVTATLSPSEALASGHWSLFPKTVARRLARDFPGLKGADIALASDLPIAAGLSSSTAFITALAMAVMGRNDLAEQAEFRRAVGTREALAGYLSAVENGYAFGPLAGDKGIGTEGGGEDHTAILWCRPGSLLQCSFVPVTFEGDVPLPQGYVFAVAVSGVVADKTGNALERYNRASRISRSLLEHWRRATGRDDASLAMALRSSPDAMERLSAAVEGDREAGTLRKRLRQFHAECEEIIPGVAAALRRGDMAAVGPLVDRSQALAEDALENQIPETIGLQRMARELGAAAASAFGAGFGGSVWALVKTDEAAGFLARWSERHHARFPEAARDSQFFTTGAGPGMVRL